jgi:hypothetical protein
VTVVWRTLRRQGAIKWRVRRRRLVPQHRGVYAVGHLARTAQARWWAAILACGGPGAAVLSHRSAAAVWELVAVPSGPVDVITRRRSHATEAIRVHRTRTLRPATSPLATTSR